MLKMWFKVTAFSLLSAANLFFVFVEWGKGNIQHMLISAFFFLFFLASASEAYINHQDRT